MRKIVRTASGLIGTVVLAGATLMATPAGAADLEPTPESVPGSVMEISSGGQVILSSDPESPVGPDREDDADANAPSALPIEDHYQCMVAKNSKWPIAEYTAAYVQGFQGKVHLRCGNDAAGYRHINIRHARDWVNRVTWHNYLPASQWDNFMITATRMALKGPSRAVLEPSQKACYEAPFKQTVKDSRGKVIAQRTFYTAVTISRNNRIVITSFPPSKSHC